MKKTMFLIFALVFPMFWSPAPTCAGDETGKRAVKSEAVYLSQNSPFFDELETRLLNMMNLARQDPAHFADTYLAERARKDGKIAEFCRRMKAIPPMPPLRPSKALSLAAQDHVRDMYTTQLGKTGEKGDATRWARIEKYGKWEGHVARDISYGYSEPDSNLIQMLLNAGSPEKSNILDPQNRLAGSRIGKNKTYRFMCVVYFAVQIKE